MADGVEKDDLQKLVRWFEESEETTQEARLRSDLCRDFYDNKQWTPDEENALRKRRQPIVTQNVIKPKIDNLRGMERELRTDPKAFPRTPQHEQDADSVTDAIRYVLENEKWDFKRSDVFENMLIEGTGGLEIYAKQTKRGIEIKLGYIPWDRIFYDPHSRAKNFNDAKYKGIVVWMDQEDALGQYPNKADLIEGAMQPSGDDTYEDKPRWVDSDRKRLRVIQIYYKERGQWMYAHYTHSGFLLGPMESPWEDEDGEPECGIELQSAYVDRDGNRYGLVDGYLDAQREINKRRSKALHLINMRQTQGEKGAVEDVAQMKRELAKPDGHVEYTPGMNFQLLDTNDQTQGHLALYQEAKAHIDEMSAEGQTGISPDASGRARMLVQSTAQRKIQPVFDGLREWQLRVYRQVWNRVRQFWTEEKWIRVSDDDRNLKWVSLNKPITVRDQVEQQYGEIDPRLEGDPRLEQVVGIQNPVSELDVDIILEDAPDVVTIQSEQFELVAQMYQANPEAIPFDVVLELSSLPKKDQILERIRGDEQAQQAQQEEQQMLKQMQMRKAQLDMAEQEATIAEKQAQAIERQAKAAKTAAEVDKTDAETANTIKEIMQPPADTTVDIR